MLLDIAKDGRVLLIRADLAPRIAGHCSPDDPKQHELSWLDYTYPSDLSADGKTLLFDEEGGGGALDYSKIQRPDLRRLHSQDGRNSGGAAGGRRRSGALARWQVGDRADPRNRLRSLSLLATGAGEAARSHQRQYQP